ncbi:hypothetical protein G6011_01502 [Alternaria panax]|uniref:Uncharacterized protein n=1 Tax=Alternaria panax TaxID=48097 RepID=A0AAD4IL42_9PLEO|nr:hypothetical protein G6011_01502 [Alternaria panax]
MNSFFNIPHVRARADTATPISSILDANTPNARSVRPSPQPPSLARAIVLDSSTPPPASAQPTPQAEGMSSGTKVGLGMIPIIIALCAICIFSVFWWRKRKARRIDQDLESPPPVPEKDYVTRLPSLDSDRRGSKVFNMAAFSTHVYDGRYREAQVLGQSREFIRTIDQDQDHEREMLRTPPRSTKPEQVRSGRDSPIDGSSPFRLKRGDTLRRSLGSEISEFWPSPSPPPTAWIRRQGILDALPSSRFGRDMSRRSQCSADYTQRSDASSVF